VFREMNVPVTVFVVTGFLDGTVWLWWDRLRYFLEHGPRDRITIPVGGRQLTFDLSGEAGRARAWSDLVELLRFMPHEDKLRALDEIRRGLGVEMPARAPEEDGAFDWEAASRMAREGVDIAPHTDTHPYLSRLGVERAEGEIETSKRKVEQRLGVRARVFAYPQGGAPDYTPEVVGTVRRAGFDGAYVAHPQPGRGETPFTLGRYGASDDLVDFEWKLCGAERLGLIGRRAVGAPA
jgi:peptidoglycan/xylan/chitin deacetylase (PgdA/CDA1 family)